MHSPRIHGGGSITKSDTPFAHRLFFRTQILPDILTRPFARARHPKMSWRNRHTPYRANAPEPVKEGLWLNALIPLCGW
jgi:hypothetical protein